MYKKTIREFKISSFAVDNSISVFVLIAIITIIGAVTYLQMPREQFPEIEIPTIYVQTVYPGNSPSDIETLITRPLEKEINAIKEVEEISSTSSQDASFIIIEFNEDIEISDALQKVKDAIDKAAQELPNDLDKLPNALELDFSEIPIMIVNLSGNFDIFQLKKYANLLEDEIEELSEVSSIRMIGDIEKEIHIDVDFDKMDATNITLEDIENAVKYENTKISLGDVTSNGYDKSLRISQEFTQPEEQMKYLVVKWENGNVVYLKDIATISNYYAERKSYSRLVDNHFLETDSYPVISLQIIKKSRENLLEADRKINEIIEKMKKNSFPPDLNIIQTQRQSKEVINLINNLENSIISGIILVGMVLLFFMGLRNAIFVGIAIPLSILCTFFVFSFLDTTINLMVLFSLILALGMLVDNAIVVIENIYRLLEEGKSTMEAVKQGVGEVAVAIIASTITTLAVFFPLAFWGGIIGEFMKFLPITLIIVLSCSLFVGLVINPVVAKSFMRLEEYKRSKKKHKKLQKLVLFILLLAIPSYFIFDTFLVGNILMTLAVITLLNLYTFKPLSRWFQQKVLMKIEKAYARLMQILLSKRTPYFAVLITFVFLFSTMALFFLSQPSILLFPKTEPELMHVYLEAPIGIDIKNMSERVKGFESKLFKQMAPYRSIVESIVINIGANNADQADRSAMMSQNGQTNKARIDIDFIDYENREGLSTTVLLKELEDFAKNETFFKVLVASQQSGPPVGKPINIEVVGDDYNELLVNVMRIKDFIDKENIPGIENLIIDIETQKPEVLVTINREMVRQLGLSTSRIGGILRNAIFGKEISLYKESDEDYSIMLRMDRRDDIDYIQNRRITFRDMKGVFRKVPMSSIAQFDNVTSISQIKHKNLDKIITLNSGVLEGYNPNDVVKQIKDILIDFPLPLGYKVKFTGEQEEIANSFSFLFKAFSIGIAFIFFILVSQFNSVTKPFIIIIAVLFSMIGVFLGLSFFSQDFVVIMTGIGIVSLAGIVVNNAIVLVDYTDLIVSRKVVEQGVEAPRYLSSSALIESIIKAGTSRLRPVLLTAITTILGLVPLAMGFNIDFFGLYNSFQPAIYIGGTNAEFWGPMAWTVVYGLLFSTFLTLIIVPVMYLLSRRLENFYFKLNK